jgi:integrase
MPNVPRRHQTIATVATLYNGKLRLERRNTNPTIHARAFLHGKTVGKSTGEQTLGAATKVATDWYLAQLDGIRNGAGPHGTVPLFSDIAGKFLRHVTRQAEVSAGQQEQYHIKWHLLKKHFTGVNVADVDARFLMTLRDTRSQEPTQCGTLTKPATIRKDLTFVRLVLRYAKEWEKCLPELPQFPSFRGEKWTCSPSPRPFLNRTQWRTVRDLAIVRAVEPDLNPRTRRQREELACFVMLCVGAALRVGEAHSLRWKDCHLVRLNDQRRTQAVHLSVLGKHSTGHQREEGFGLYDAVVAFKRLRAARPDATPDDLLFLENHRDGMKHLLVAAGLRTDGKTGRTRDAKSLRQTGISLRLDYGPQPDYRDIAKWARTSPAMIATFYDQTHPQQSVERIAGFRVPLTKRKKPTATLTT